MIQRMARCSQIQIHGLLPRISHLWGPPPLLRDVDLAQLGGPLLQAASLLVCPFLMVQGLFHKLLPQFSGLMKHPSVQPCVPISCVLACFLRGPRLYPVFGELQSTHTDFR